MYANIVLNGHNPIRCKRICNTQVAQRCLYSEKGLLTHRATAHQRLITFGI